MADNKTRPTGARVADYIAVVSIAILATALATGVVAGLTAHGATRTDGESVQQDAPMPGWLRQEMTRLAQGTGIWVTDNRLFMSDDERFDHYGLEWTWGPGKQSLKGRLYGIIDGNDVGTFWEYRMFWHPGESQAILEQFGSDGTYGVGVVTAGDQGGTRMDQTFYAPDGSTRRSGHESSWDDEAHLTQQLEWRDGGWAKDRLYRWTRND
jgi:hypothetical protein